MMSVQPGKFPLTKNFQVQQSMFSTCKQIYSGAAGEGLIVFFRTVTEQIEQKNVVILSYFYLNIIFTMSVYLQAHI